MNKDQIKLIMDEMRLRKDYPGTDLEPLFGLALSSFPKDLWVTKECIVQSLRWHSLNFDGSINEFMLNEFINLLKIKRVNMF